MMKFCNETCNVYAYNIQIQGNMQGTTGYAYMYANLSPKPSYLKKNLEHYTHAHVTSREV